jgi:hypothetical protein
LVVLAAFFVFLCTASGLELLLGGAALMGICALAVWRWPGWAAVALAALTPVNRFLILLFFHWTHSSGMTMAVQLWKDGLILVLLARAIHDALTSRRPTRIRYLDLLVVTFLLLSTLYLFFPGSDLRVGLLSRLLGFRADAFFLLAYLAGRYLHLERRHVRWLLLSLVPGTLLVAAVAAAQFAWPGWFNRFFDSLSFQEFIRSQGGIGEIVAVRARGISGIDLPRASSLLLGDLALAFYQILLVAVGASFLFQARRNGHRLAAGSFLILMIVTVVLTVTRSAVLVLVPVILCMGLIARGLGRLVVVGLVCATLGITALTLSGIRPEGLRALTSPGEASVQGHVDAARRSIALIRAEPFGRGLGTAATVGQRLYGPWAITNENWYFQLATEMGVAAGLLYLVIVLTAVGTSFATYARLRDPPLRILVLAVAGGGLGFLLMGGFLHVWEVPVLSMLFWFLAGVAVSAPDLEASFS